MKKIIGILFVTALFALAGCEKDGEFRTTYRITSWVQFESGGASFIARNVKAYVYYGDTTYWEIASWEDAVRGIVTNKDDGRRIEPVSQGVPDNDYRITLGPLTQEEMMVLVCYTEPDDAAGAKMYAWRNTTIKENLPAAYLTVTFKPWRKLADFSDSRWTMYNDLWVAEPDSGL